MDRSPLPNPRPRNLFSDRGSGALGSLPIQASTCYSGANLGGQSHRPGVDSVKAEHLPCGASFAHWNDGSRCWPVFVVRLFRSGRSRGIGLPRTRRLLVILTRRCMRFSISSSHRSACGVPSVASRGADHDPAPHTGSIRYWGPVSAVVGAQLSDCRAYVSHARGLRVRRFWGLIWTLAGAQPGHGFPAPGGSRGTRTDTTVRQFEFRRTSGEPPGHGRTCNQHGSGP